MLEIHWGKDLVCPMLTLFLVGQDSGRSLMWHALCLDDANFQVVVPSFSTLALLACSVARIFSNALADCC